MSRLLYEITKLAGVGPVKSLAGMVMGKALPKTVASPGGKVLQSGVRQVVGKAAPAAAAPPIRPMQKALSSATHRGFDVRTGRPMPVGGPGMVTKTQPAPVPRTGPAAPKAPAGTRASQMYQEELKRRGAAFEGARGGAGITRVSPGMQASEGRAALWGRVHGQMGTYTQQALANTPLVRSGVSPQMASQLAAISAKPGESTFSAITRHATGATPPSATVRRIPTVRAEAPTVATPKVASVEEIRRRVKKFGRRAAGIAGKKLKSWGKGLVELAEEEAGEIARKRTKGAYITSKVLQQLPRKELRKMPEEIRKLGYTYSQYGGQPAENPPGRKKTDLIPPFVSPALSQVKTSVGYQDNDVQSMQDTDSPGDVVKSSMPIHVHLAWEALEKAAGVGVGSSMSTSQYSGPLSYGPFKMVSGIPPFSSPGMSPPWVEQAAAPWARGQNVKTAAMGGTTEAMTPAGRLSNTQRVGAPKVTKPTGPSIADFSKPIGFGTKLPGTTKEAVVKRALIERLVRIGATPIPRTPKLVMKSRSPGELKALQDAVERGWEGKVTEPLMGVSEKVIKKLPKSMQERSRDLLRLAAEDPVGALAVNAVPFPGAYPGYLAGKKGLEKVIDASRLGMPTLRPSTPIPKSVTHEHFPYGRGGRGAVVL